MNNPLTQRPLTFAELSKMDGLPVWVHVPGITDEDGMYCLIEVDDVDDVVWLTNNYGGRSLFRCDDDLKRENVTVFTSKPNHSY